MTKPAKYFVKHVGLNIQGNVLQQVVLTPPLDTKEEAEVYAAWYWTETNLLYRVVVDKMSKGAMPAVTDLVVRVFETTLY